MYGEYCTFCEIIAGRLPSRKRFEDEDSIVFDNHLDWLPVMLLVVPRVHMTQTELWNNSSALSKVCSLSVRLGHEYCKGGFRILSNFGSDSLQTQNHGHLHVLGGRPMGLYIRPPYNHGNTVSEVSPEEQI